MTGSTAARVEDAVAGVEDPDFGASVVEAGVVTDVTVEAGVATVSVNLAGTDPESAEEVTEAIRRAAFEVSGVEQVRVEGETPDGAGGTDRTGAGERSGVSLPGIDHVIAVGSAKGGVGKTTVATHLARALADDYDVGLFDADLHGPNVPETVGVEGPVEATDDGRATPVEVDGIEVMSVGLVAGDAPLAWRGAMAHDALTELLGDTAWSDRDVLVVDLPPGTGDVVLTTLQEVPVAGAILVTTPFPTSLSDTSRTADLLADDGVPVVGAVVNMRGFTCEECGHDHDLYGDGDPADALGVDVLAELPFDRRLQPHGDPGGSASDDHAVVDAGTPDPVANLADAVGAFLESDDAGPTAIPDSALDVRGMPPRVRHEQVAAEFRALDPGEAFHVVADRDPSPLAEALASEVTGEAPEEAFDACEVARRGPDEWVLRIERAG